MAGMGTHEKLDRFGVKLGDLIASNPALVGVAVIGFSVSFQTIARLAATHGLPGWPPLYPVGIDVGILALIAESRKAIDDHRSDLVPRVLAWALAALTIYINAHGAPANDWLGRAMHIVMPALWVAFLELTRWRKLAKRKADSKREGIPLARWVIAPRSSVLMHRRMVLRNIRSYAVAVELDDARRFARDITRAHFGRGWKRQAPRVLMARIRDGRLGDDVTTAATQAVSEKVTGGWEDHVRTLVRKAVTEGDKLTAEVKRERRQIDRQDDEQTDGQKPKRRTVKKQVSATVTKQAEVRRLLTVDPPLKLSEIASRAGVSESTVTRIKRQPERKLESVS